MRKAPSDDELELVALDFLRQRFLRTDERMAGLLATLKSQIDAAPAQERPSLRHAADQTAEIQQRLRAQLGSLPRGSEERRQILKRLLDVQSGALQQLSVLVERNTRLEAKVAHPTKNSLTRPREASVAGRALANAHVERSPVRKPPATHRPLGRRPWRRVAIVELMRSHRMTVLAAMAVAAFYAYAHLPRAYTPHETVRDPTTAAAGGSHDGPKYPASLADADDTTDRKSMPVSPGIIVTRPSGGAAGAASLPSGPVRMQQLEGTRGDKPAEASKDAAHLPMGLLPSLGARQARNPAAGDEQGSATSPVRMPTPAADNGEDRAAKPEPPPRFVAVVFTHREPASAISAFAELQQRYPRVLAKRKGEAQAVEVAEQGTWHRLVVLPAGSRQNAAGLCEQLLAAGYDRCWVKPY